LTFFITTSFFGKTEIVGHTLLHATLLVFILKGAGKFYTAPIKIHNSFLLKNLFAIVNFLILFFTMGYFYEIAASKHYEKIQSQSKMLAHPKFIVNDLTKIPQIKAEALQDLHGGWNLHIITENFQFTPEKFLMADVQGEGHAHLYINGKKIGRIYSPWYHLQLSEGKNTIKISLNTNSHKDYSLGGEDIFYTMEIVETRKLKHIH
jgi:TM2 domain-containing membrane protein YozV